MTFTPGTSGNPAGRPRGARNRASLDREAAFRDRAFALLEKLFEKAEAGDMAAARLVLARTLPPARDASLDLPEITDVRDAQAGSTAVLSALAMGELDPREVAVWHRALQDHARIVRQADNERDRAERAAAADRARQRNRALYAALAEEYGIDWPPADDDADDVPPHDEKQRNTSDEPVRAAAAPSRQEMPPPARPAAAEAARAPGAAAPAPALRQQLAGSAFPFAAPALVPAGGQLVAAAPSDPVGTILRGGGGR